MNEKQFKKGINELKNVRMTDEESSRLLERIFSLPTESPYVKRSRVFALVHAHYAHYALVVGLVFAISAGGVVYASEASLPGDALYSIKIGLIEPFLDIVNRAPGKRIVWEEEKVMRRLSEAEKLANSDRLDEERASILERGVEKGANAFVKAVHFMLDIKETPVLAAMAKARADSLKQEFRLRISGPNEIVFTVIDQIDQKENEVKQPELPAAIGDRATSSEQEAEIDVVDEVRISSEPSDDDGKESLDTKREWQKERVRRLKETVLRILDNDDDDNQKSNQPEPGEDNLIKLEL